MTTPQISRPTERPTQRPTERPTQRPTSRPTRPAAVVDGRLSARLNREWAEITARRSAARQAHRWNLGVDLGVDLGDGTENPLVRILRVTRQPTTEAEIVLRRLVETAHADDLAARLVLQRILPGLLMSAQRSRSTDRFDDLIGSAWVVIRTFDIERRPACLAAALIRSAEHHAYKAAARRLGSGEFAIDTTIAPPAAAAGDSGHDRRLDAPEPILELAEVLLEARDHGLAPADIDWATGLIACASTEDYATQLGVTARTVRNHRAAVARRIKKVVDSAA